MLGTASTHFHRPYVLPTVVCHRRKVPSSEPEAYNSPSGENFTQWTGPKCPLNDSATKKGHFLLKNNYLHLLQIQK